MLDLCYINPADNAFRYYTTSIEHDLFGDIVLIRRWGRIGSHGSIKRSFHSDLASAEAAQDKIVRQKLRRGYVPAVSKEYESQENQARLTRENLSGATGQHKLRH